QNQGAAQGAVQIRQARASEACQETSWRTFVSSKWTADQIPSEQGRTAIVTGANSGIGFETAVELARAGAKVILACRNPDKATAALAKLRERAPQADATLMTLDLSSLASVRRFATEFRAQHARLDLL